MKTIAMSGSSGFVGTHLRRVFSDKSWEILPIGRAELAGGKAALDALIERSDAVVNLAGAPIVGRWTSDYKKLLRSSRIDTTRAMVDSISRIATRTNAPKVLVSTSAVGVYARAGEHTEESFIYAGDFLCRLALDWEAAALRADALGVRTVVFRFGIVLGKDGGMLGQMVPIFNLGLGGTIGDGSQPLSWVHIDDIAGAFVQAIEDDTMRGIYNLTAPNPSTNAELTRELASALKRPAVFRVPMLALKLQFGEGATAIASGQRALPERLLREGFRFKHTELGEAVRASI